MPPRPKLQIHSAAVKVTVAKSTAAARKAAAAALPRIGQFILTKLEERADVGLRPQQAREYKAGLHAPGSVVLSSSSITIELQGLARELEEGFSAFDMKIHLLKSATTKWSKDGEPYIDIPFRHGSHGGTVLFQGMPSHVKAMMAKAVTAGQSRLQGKTAGKTFRKDLLFGGQTLSIGVKHKQGIHDDMMRIETGTQKKKMGKYMTIRRISGKSSATSWFHPGYAGLHAIPAIKNAVRSTAKKILVEELLKVGVGVK